MDYYPVYTKYRVSTAFISIYYEIAKTKQDKQKCVQITGSGRKVTKYPRTVVMNDVHSYWADSRVRTEDEPWESEPQYWVPKDVAIMMIEWLSENVK